MIFADRIVRKSAKNDPFTYKIDDQSFLERSKRGHGTRDIEAYGDTQEFL